MMNYTDVITKLVGEIQPAGDSAIDAKRFENLEEMCQLVDNLVSDLRFCASNHSSRYASMKKAGDYARKFLIERLDIQLND